MKRSEMRAITGRTKICMIIGDPVAGSLSPLMHNRGYQVTGLDGEFIYVGAKVSPSSLKEAVDGIRAMGIRGISCTMPHKEAIIPLLDEVDPVATQIGAVNTVVNSEGRLVGYNTDWLGIVAPLEELRPLHNERVLLLGTGGAARAAAYGVVARGGKLTVMGRNLEAAEKLAYHYGGSSSSFEELSVVSDCSIIINATPIGMFPHEDESPLPPELITPHHIIFDTVYSPYQTKLLRSASDKGATVVHGTQMLLHQGVAQFELYTGVKAPVREMREILEQTVGLQ